MALQRMIPMQAQLKTVRTPFNLTALPLTYSLTEAPGWLSFNGTTIQGTPSVAGSVFVTVKVQDVVGNAVFQRYELVVRPANQAPTISSSPGTAPQVTRGITYRYDLVASDPDGDPLTYSVVSPPAGLSIDSLGRVTWATTPTTPLGPVTISLRVTDDRGAVTPQNYTLTVAADTLDPDVELRISSNPVAIGTEIVFLVLATDSVGVESQRLQLSSTSPSYSEELSLDASGRATKTFSQAFPSLTVTASAKDAAGRTGSDTETLVVFDPSDGNPPTVSLSTPAEGSCHTSGNLCLKVA